MRFLKNVLIILPFILISCSQQGKNQVSQKEEKAAIKPVEVDLPQIRKNGKIVAFLDNSSTSYFLYRGKPMGFEYELLKRYAKDIGLELEIKIMSGIGPSMDELNKGEGDILAHFLTITKDRKKIVDFTDPLVKTNQVLVQKKPEGWRKMHPNTVDRKLLRNQVDLINKEIYVRNSSSFVERLNNLSEEIGGPIKIVEADSGTDTEELIQKVNQGELSYTVADKDLAMVNAAYYPDLDVETPISFPQQIGWAVRKTSPELRESLNTWIDKSKKSGLLNILYNKYFVVNRTLVNRAQSEFASISGTRISDYDEILKIEAQKINWDWKLLASLSYQESRFRKDIKSWAGAVGLMQLMPRTGKQFGATNLTNPTQNIKAGVSFIKYLDNQWKDKIEDPEERKKFILASYNAGYGHVNDARNLAEALGYDKNKWFGEVEKAILLKQDPKYFNRKEVKYGYCRGSNVKKYVSQILDRYEKYHQLYEENALAKNVN